MEIGVREIASPSARKGFGMLAALVLAACSCEDAPEPARDLPDTLGSDASGAGGSGGFPNDGAGARTSTGGSGGSGGSVWEAGGAAGDGALPAGGWWDSAATEWKTLAWAPVECEARYAVDPARALPPLEWQPCPGGSGGCSLFTVPAPPDKRVVTDITATRSSNGYRFGVSMQILQVEPWTQTAGLYETSGLPAFAIRGRSENCIFHTPRVWAENVCAAVAVITETDQRLHLACAAPHDLAGLAQPTKVFPFLNQGMRLGDGMLTMWVGALTSAVYVLPPEDRLIELYYDGGTTSFLHPNGYGQHAFAVGWRQNGASDGFVFSLPNILEPVVQPAPQKVVDIQGDETSLVWVQADPLEPGADSYQNASLWRSPLATTPAALVPTKLRDIGSVWGEYHSLVGSGYYAFSPIEGDLNVFRVADGRRWVARFPEGYKTRTDYPWLDDEHVFYQAAPLIPGSKIGIVRQRLDALGPGD